MFVGVVITALTIANLQQLVTNLDASRLNFQRKMELIKKFMGYRKLPSDLQERILAFYDYQWAVLKGADEERVSEYEYLCSPYPSRFSRRLVPCSFLLSCLVLCSNK